MRTSGIPPDAVNYNVYLTGCAKLRQVDLTLKAFASMKSAKVKMDAIAYSTVIELLCKANRAEEGFALFSEMKNPTDANPTGVKPNAVIFRTLIEASTKKRHFDRAAKLLGLMLDAGHKAEDAAVAVIIDGYCREGQHDTALALVRSLFRQGVPAPSVAIFNLTFKACAKGPVAMLQKAIDLFIEESQAKRVVWTEETYAILLAGLVRRSFLDKAVSLFDAMAKNGFKPTPALYTTCVEALAKAGNIAQCFKLAKAGGCETEACTALLAQFARTGAHTK
jgi:pentatricopeptide repeat protein